MSDKKVKICSVFINSEIHPSLYHKKHLLELQYPVRKENCQFLKYDSFINCAYTNILIVEDIIHDITTKKSQIIGTLIEEDINEIRRLIVNSGLLSQSEITEFNLVD